MKEEATHETFFIEVSCSVCGVKFRRAIETDPENPYYSLCKKHGVERFYHETTFPYTKGRVERGEDSTS